MQGAGDCLSNFSPCTFEFGDRLYRSTEHAYLTEEALFLNRYEVAHEIRWAHNARAAKRASKPLKFDPNSGEWDKQKRKIMKEILWEKSQQVPLFKKELLKSHPKRLTHILPKTRDSFWATEYTTSYGGRPRQGQDVFATLLMETRHRLMHSPTDQPPRSPNSPTDQCPRSSNRFAVLQDLNNEEAFPPLAPPAGGRVNHSPPATRSVVATRTAVAKPQSQQGSAMASHNKATANPPSAPAQITTQPATQVPTTNASVPSKHYHPGGSKGSKSSWPSPSCSADLIILGDSNINRITQLALPLETVNSVEYHSYSGARFINFQSQALFKNNPQTAPKKVILSVGINSKANCGATNTDQIKKSINAAKKYFPNAHIYIPQINYSATFLDKEQSNLEHMNKCLFEAAGKTECFDTIPKLDSSVFKTEDKDPIHWTTSTANALLQHWLTHLN